MADFLATLLRGSRSGHNLEYSQECNMDEKNIQDWLLQSTTLSPGEVNSFASNLKHNSELIGSIFTVLDEHRKFHNLIEPISKQLFNYYRSKEFELRLFTLQFLPNLIYIYLNSVAKGDKKSYHSIETLLIGIYNLEVVDEAGQPSVISFRLPSLAQSSIYHESMSLSHVSLTENALRRLEECNTKLITWGPHQPVETLNAQNRLKTITKLLFVYNRYIGSLNKLSLKYLCKVSSRLASQGFRGSHVKSASSKPEGTKSEKQSRIPVSYAFFLELLCGLYYAMYNDYGHLAMKAVDDIYNRSCYECYANVIAVANAIKNSSHVTSSGQGNEGPMGISVALSPATTTVTTVNKFMITNASFRTKKLPDDIPIIQKDESEGGAGADVSKPLTSITEEKEDTKFSLRGNSGRSKETVSKNLQKLVTGKKFKEKDKEGKSSSKSSLVATGTSANNRKQSGLLQLSTFKEKVSLKSGGSEKGDFGVTETVNGHSPSFGRVKAAENGPGGEASGEEVSESLGCQSSLNSDNLDTPSSTDVVGFFGTPKNSDEKPFTRVSSV